MSTSQGDGVEVAAIRAGAEATAGMAARLAAVETEVAALRAELAGLRGAAPAAPAAPATPAGPAGGLGQHGTGPVVADSFGVVEPGDETSGAEPRGSGSGTGEDVDPEPAAKSGSVPPLADSFGAGGTDDEGARIVALNMALNGTSREDVDKYLAEHFELADRAALLDEVYAKVT